MSAAHRSTLLLLWNFGDQGFRGQHQRRNRSGILQRGPHNLRRIEHARFDQIFVLAGQGVVAVVVILRVVDFAQDDGAFFAGILGDLAQRFLDGASYNVHANLLIALEFQLVECGDAASQSHSATGDNAFLDCGAGCMHGIFDASLLLFHFGLGRSANLDHSHATYQLRQPLLQLLAVVVAGGLFDLATDFLHPALNVSGLAFAFDDGRVVLVDGDLLGLAEIADLHVLELNTEILSDGLATSEFRDVIQHGLAAIAEAGRLDGGDLQRATQLVHDEGCERFAFDILGDDQQRTAALRNLLEQRKKILHRADLLFVNQDVRILQRGFHALGIGDEIRRQIAAVELHAFDHFELRLERLGFFHGDDAIFADFLHRLGDDLANGLVVVGADGADLSNHVSGHGLGELVELALDPVAFFIEAAADSGNGLLDAALHRHRIGAGSNRLHAFAIDRLSQNGSGGGAVARDVRGLRRNFTYHLRAHVFLRVLQFDFFCDGNAVLGNGRRTEFLFNHNVAALGTESDFHCIGENIHAAKNRLSRILSMYDCLCHNFFSPKRF